MKNKKVLLLIVLLMLILIPNAAFAAEETASNIGLTCDDVHYVTEAYFSLRIIAPFLLILFGSIDFIKAVMANDAKKQQEARSKFPKRLIAFFLLIILPFTVEYIFSTFGHFSSNNMTVLCCVVTNGNSSCDDGVTSSGGSGIYNRTNPTNSDYVSEDESNMPGGDNYISPVTRRTTIAATKCINEYYGECNSINSSTGKCSCTYTSRENLSKASLCENDPYHVGMKTQQEGSGGATHVTCYYNARLSESGQTIADLTSLSTTPSLLGKVAKTNNNFDAYFAYERKIKTTSAADCSSLENHYMSCNSENSCICIYGKGIVPSSQASDTDYNRTIDNSNATRNANINRYNTLVNLLNTAQLNGSKYYRQEVKDFVAQYPYNNGAVLDSMYPISSTIINCAVGFQYSGMYYCPDLSDDQLNWLKNYMDSFRSDCGIFGCNHTANDLEIAINYLNSMNRIHQEGYDVFLGNFEDFKELTISLDLYSTVNPSFSDYNTQKLYQCLKPDGSLYDCAN